LCVKSAISFSKQGEEKPVLRKEIEYSMVAEERRPVLAWIPAPRQGAPDFYGNQ
jgi:hypothetical protein